MYHRTDEELPRTNNSVAGWHRSFQRHVSACHPNFWKFLEMLKKEETVVRVNIIIIIIIIIIVNIIIKYTIL